jgi:hypothetical protein
VRALVAHLVAQCQDGIHLASMARRELLGRRRYPDKAPVDAYMAVGVDDHRAASGPELVERFTRLWPRAARARRRRPALLRRIKLDLVPDANPGQTLAVLEMLIGQLFLVTAVARVVSAWQPRQDRGRPATESDSD